MKTPRILPFVKPKPPKPSIFDVPGGLKFSVSVTVERPRPEKPAK